MSDEPLLRVRDLRVQFQTRAGLVRAVDGINFHVNKAETLAIVGESGCGKSVTALSILRLIETQGGRIASGAIEFGGKDLTQLGQDELRRIRGNHISMIFQEPMTSLNPVFTVGDQIAEVVRLHRGMDGAAARRETQRLLELVEMPAAEQRLDEYPHQLSGGMRQRVMIAMALAADPQLLIADEPTTALDVTIQAQILDLLRQLQARLGMSLLLITHDLGVVARMARRVCVMYAGQIVETASVYDLFERPKHPYTVGLFHSLPELEPQGRELRPIEGQVPDALAFPSGCRFHPRCSFCFQPCPGIQPEPTLFRGAGELHSAACHYSAQHPELDLLREAEARYQQRRVEPSETAPDADSSGTTAADGDGP